MVAGKGDRKRSSEYRKSGVSGDSWWEKRLQLLWLRAKGTMKPVFLYPLECSQMQSSSLTTIYPIASILIYHKNELLSKQAGSLKLRMSLYQYSVYRCDQRANPVPASFLPGPDNSTHTEDTNGHTAE
jgi:hypothetical protein